MSDQHKDPDFLSEIMTNFPKCIDVKSQDPPAEPPPSPIQLFLGSHPFECKKCKIQLSRDSLLESVISFGVILLSSSIDSLIGWSCPSCRGRTTNLIKLANDEFSILIREIHNSITVTYPQGLCYRSFPFHFESSESLRTGSATSFLDRDINQIELQSTVSCYDPSDPPDGYCSFVDRSFAQGPAIYISWHNFDQVVTLVNLENEKGLKAFPRYIAYNPLYSALDNFSSTNRIDLQLINDMHLPLGFKELFLSPEKKHITKAFEFLRILDTFEERELHTSSTNPSMNLLISPSMVRIPGLTKDASARNKISLNQHHNLSNRVWAKFTSDWMQTILDQCAEDFIEKYISLSNEVTCSLPRIWELKKTSVKG